MQELDPTIPFVQAGPVVNNTSEEYLLQYNDIIDVQIATTSQDINTIFESLNGIMANMAGAQGIQGAQNGGDAFFMQGYTVDDNGMIELPLIGSMKVLGMTTDGVKQAIEVKMRQIVNEGDYFVRVRLGGIRFATLGEFNRNGNHTILQNRINIFQAIAHAGDMTLIAKRDEVVMIRQYPDGTRSFRINLNDKRILESEFFFIRPNDMLYAEPMKIRELGTGITFVQSFQLAVTTFTAVLLVLNALN
jgi:polysaccharide biosynthesis/export protein